MSEEVIGMGRLNNGDWYTISRRDTKIVQWPETNTSGWSVTHDDGVSWFEPGDKRLKISEFKAKARAYFDRIRKDERLWK